jgi:hypothetical protein
MQCFRVGLLGAVLFCNASSFGLAQVGGVSGGLNSDNGTNANGTPRQQDPGASITNGAGTGAMTPNVTGATTSGAGNIGLGVPKTIPPTVITHGTVTQDGNSP